MLELESQMKAMVDDLAALDSGSQIRVRQRVAKRRRRTRSIGVAIILGLLASGAIAVSASRGAQSPATVAVSPRGAAADGLKIRGSGLLIKLPNKPLQLCTGGVLLSLPPYCAGFKVVGVSLGQFAKQQTANGVHWVDSVIVTGTFHNGALYVSHAKAGSLPAVPGPNNPVPVATCVPPPSPPLSSNDQLVASAFIGQVANRYPVTFAGGWIDPNGVVALRFTDAPNSYAQDLASMYARPFCVLPGQHSIPDLKALIDAINAQGNAVVAPYGVNLQSAGLDDAADRIEVRLDIPVRAAITALKRTYGAEISVSGSVKILGDAHR